MQSQHWGLSFACLAVAKGALRPRRLLASHRTATFLSGMEKGAPGTSSYKTSQFTLAQQILLFKCSPPLSPPVCEGSNTQLTEGRQGCLAGQWRLARLFGLKVCLTATELATHTPPRGSLGLGGKLGGEGGQGTRESREGSLKQGMTRVEQQVAVTVGKPPREGGRAGPK